MLDVDALIATGATRWKSLGGEEVENSRPTSGIILAGDAPRLAVCFANTGVEIALRSVPLPRPGLLQ